MTQEAPHFLIQHDDIRTHRIETAPQPSCPPGHVVLRIERFALTANNITYAKLGHKLGYWKLFPASDPGWSHLPAMGYATVETSQHPSLQPGDRLSGFFPTARYLTIAPTDTPEIYDGTPHRQDLPPGYNTYHKVLPTSEEVEDRTLLLNALFMTGFLIHDYLDTHDDFGAQTLLLSSASSKTAMATAHQAATRTTRTHLIGLTSPQNQRFVQNLGCYDEVIVYDDLETLPQQPTTFLDFAGSNPLTTRIHHHLQDNLRKNITIGATHWDAPPSTTPLPGPEPEIFFAPVYGQKRAEELGPQVLGTRMAAAWGAFLGASESWLHVLRVEGPDTLTAIYDALLDGRILPHEGYVISL